MRWVPNPLHAVGEVTQHRAAAGSGPAHRAQHDVLGFCAPYCVADVGIPVGRAARRSSREHHREQHHRGDGRPGASPFRTDVFRQPVRRAALAGGEPSAFGADRPDQHRGDAERRDDAAGDRDDHPGQPHDRISSSASRPDLADVHLGLGVEPDVDQLIQNRSGRGDLTARDVVELHVLGTHPGLLMEETAQFAADGLSGLRVPSSPAR